jgi:hypothetical protein
MVAETTKDSINIDKPTNAHAYRRALFEFTLPLITTRAESSDATDRRNTVLRSSTTRKIEQTKNKTNKTRRCVVSLLFGVQFGEILGRQQERLCNERTNDEVTRMSIDTTNNNTFVSLRHTKRKRMGSSKPARFVVYSIPRASSPKPNGALGDNGAKN